MTASFFVADDGYESPTIWAGETEDAYPRPMLARYDVVTTPDDGPGNALWDLIVAAVQVRNALNVSQPATVGRSLAG
jgi:hypothetical protein